MDKVLFKSVVAGHNFHLMFLGLVLIFPSGRFSHHETTTTDKHSVHLCSRPANRRPFWVPWMCLSCTELASLVRCLPLTKCHVLVRGETPPQKCHIRCDAHGPEEMGDSHHSWQPQKSFGRQPRKFASVWFLTSDRRDRAVFSLERVSEAPFFSHAPVQRQTPHFGSSSTQGVWRTSLHCAGPAHTQWRALRVDGLS